MQELKQNRFLLSLVEGNFNLGKAFENICKRQKLHTDKLSAATKRYQVHNIYWLTIQTGREGAIMKQREHVREGSF